MPEQQQEQRNQQQLVNQRLEKRQTEKEQQSEDITEGWEEIKEWDLIIEAGIDTWDNPMEEKQKLEKGQEAVIEKNQAVETKLEAASHAVVDLEIGNVEMIDKDLEKAKEEREQKEYEEFKENLSMLETSLRKAKLSKSQALRRIKTFFKLWQPKEYMADDKKDAWDQSIKQFKEKYLEEAYGKTESWDDLEEKAETEIIQELQYKTGYHGVVSGQTDLNLFSKERQNRLKEADQWLLNQCLKKDSKMQQSIVFSVLNRPACERMLIYYMMEHGYQKTIRPSFISMSQLYYKPNRKMLEKRGLHFENLGEIYQQVFAAQKTVELWNQAACQQERYQEGLDEPEEENAAALKEKHKEILNQMADLEETTTKYVEHKGKKLSRSKRKLEQDIRDKVNKLVEELVKFAKEQQVADQSENTLGKELQNANKKDEKKSPTNAELLQKIGGGIVTGIGGSAKAMQPALTAAKLSGTEAAAILGMKAKSTQVVEQAQSWKAQAMEASRDANILGAVLGVLGMGTSLILGTLEFCKSYPSMDNWTIAEKIAGLYNGGLSGANNVAGSIAKLAVTSNACTTGVAVAGIAVGGLSTAVGAYNFVHAGIQVRQRKKADKAFAELDGEKEKSEKSREEKAIHENLSKIHQRITDRKALTAGCQIISGICTVAAGSISLALAAIPAASLVAAGLGIAAFGVGIAGQLITKRMKKRDFQTFIDDFFDMESILAKIEGDLPQNKKFSKSDKKKMATLLRQELMEQFGFTKQRDFHSYMMRQYAEHIYSKIKDVLENTENKIQDASQEQKAYLEFVRSLGLKVKQKQAKNGKEKEKEKETPGIPTMEMIYQKLMS